MLLNLAFIVRGQTLELGSYIHTPIATFLQLKPKSVKLILGTSFRKESIVPLGSNKVGNWTSTKTVTCKKKPVVAVINLYQMNLL